MSPSHSERAWLQRETSATPIDHRLCWGLLDAMTTPYRVRDVKTQKKFADSSLRHASNERVELATKTSPHAA